MKREYYILFSCDAWKGKDSMRLMGVFTEKKLKTIIRREIRAKNFELSIPLKELKTTEAAELDRHLEYGYIETVSVNNPHL